MRLCLPLALPVLGAHGSSLYILLAWWVVNWPVGLKDLCLCRAVWKVASLVTGDARILVPDQEVWV